MDDVDVELLRLGLWTLFAAASVHRSEQRNRPNDTHTGVQLAAIAEADELVRAAEQRFPFLARPEPPIPTLT